MENEGFFSLPGQKMMALKFHTLWGEIVKKLANIKDTTLLLQ